MIPQALHTLVIAVGTLGGLPVAPQLPSGHAVTMRSDCRAADEERVPHILKYFKELLSTTDSAQVAVRDSLGLGAAQPAMVRLVTTRSTCVQATEALNSLFGEPGLSRNVWVYQLGDNYAVEDPDSAERSYDLFIFSKAFVYKSTLVGI